MSLLKRIERERQGTTQEPVQVEVPSRKAEMRVRRQPASPARDAYLDLKTRIHYKLIADLDPMMDITQTAEVRRTIEEMYNNILAEEHIILSRAEHQRLFEQIVAEILGLGPLEPFLADPTLTGIMVNGAKNIYVERGGRIERTNAAFESDEHLMRVIERIVAPLGRRLDESIPYADARLQDGSRVNAVIPPISSIGPVLVIRKFFKIPLTVERLIEFGSVTPGVMEFLKACVISQMNILISGGSGSGKTTLLNVLSGYIPSDERLITIENVAELQLRPEHVVTLESRPPNIEGRGEVNIYDLVTNCSWMRPDRLVLGELRRGMYEAMVAAANLCGGFLSTIHADSPHDAISQLERFASEDCPHLPMSLAREQVADSIDLIVQQKLMTDGSRRVTRVTEVGSVRGQEISLQDIFVFKQAGVGAGRIIGHLRPTGYYPDCLGQIEARGIRLPRTIFT